MPRVQPHRAPFADDGQLLVETYVRVTWMSGPPPVATTPMMTTTRRKPGHAARPARRDPAGRAGDERRDASRQRLAKEIPMNESLDALQPTMFREVFEHHFTWASGFERNIHRYACLLYTSRCV